MESDICENRSKLAEFSQFKLCFNASIIRESATRVNLCKILIRDQDTPLRPSQFYWNFVVTQIF
jgi:hypothetical protein